MRAGNLPVCEKCGPRPEQDADFCSNCGSTLLS
jgi:ribosomal protein L40E